MDKEKIDKEGIDREKIDNVLNQFLKEQELEAEREQKRQAEALRKEKIAKLLNRMKIVFAILLIGIILLLNPYSLRLYKDHKEKTRPKEEYTLQYNYSQGMEVLDFGENLIIYDSSNLKLLKPSGEEIFNINLAIDSWNIAVSDKSIYLLDKVTKELYFISAKGEFKNIVQLSNIPTKVISGKNGSVAVYYKTDVGIEGVVFLDSKGKVIEDLNYPKVSITHIEINEHNQLSVHGIYRMEPSLTNNIYYYSAEGRLIYSGEIADAIVIDQIDFTDRVLLFDVNNIIMLKRNTQEELFRISSSIPYKSVKLHQDQIYVLDKRNKLIILDLDGNIIDEKYYQSEFDDITWLNSETVFYNREFVKTLNSQMNFTKPIEKVMNVGNYIAVVMKGEVKLVNKID